MTATDDEDRDKGKTSHIDKPLGERLRIERDAAKLTRGELARTLDVSESTVQQWEEGRTRLPASRLWQICKVLALDVSEVFEALPHHILRPGMADEGAPAFVVDGARVRRISSLTRAAAKLPNDRLDIAVDLIKVLKPKY